MTVQEFMFRHNFTEVITDNIVENAIQVIQTEWAGVNTLWHTLPSGVRTAKRNLCLQYLVAWWLADAYPAETTGVYTSGGIPLQSKKIGNVQLTFKDRNNQDALTSLQSNFFGLKVLDMLNAVPEVYQLY